MRIIACWLALLLVSCSSSKLPAPKGVQASQGVYADQIDISWDAVEGAATYMIYRFQNQIGAFEQIGYVESQYTATYNSTDSPADYPIVPGEHYYFKVSAVDEDGVEGALSERAEGWAESLVPQDFAVDLWWHKGSGVPHPGVLTNYTVDIGPDLQGILELHYYETENRTETFSITSQEYEDLYLLMLEHDMFRESWSENPRPPTGGATESLSLTADGGSFGPPTFPGTGEEIADKGAAMEAVRVLVPESLWD